MVDPLPKDVIFIKWGRFQAGAHGRWAVTALVLLAAGYIVGLWFGQW